MSKQIAKKIFLIFHHQQDKLYFFTCKIIEMYDIGTVIMKTSVGNNINEAIEKLKLYFQQIYEIHPDNFIIKLENTKKEN